MQCFRAGDDHLVTDVNARFGGGFPLHVAAGGGYPDLVLALARGERPEPRVGSYRPGVIMVRYLTQVILEHDGAGGAARGRGRLGPAHAARALKLVYPQAVDAGGADDVEIALGVYVRRVVRRWWIVAAAIVVAVAIALAGSSTGHTRYRAQTLIALGTPYTATGGAAITSAFCTSPIAPATLIKQDAIREAAERAGGPEEGPAQGARLVPGRSPGAVTRLNFTPAVNIIVQGPWRRHDDRTRRRRAGRAACHAPAASTRQARETTTKDRLDRELSEQRHARPSGSTRRRQLLAKVQADTSLSTTDRLLAATVAGNTLSNVTQRQNQLDQFIGDDQSLLEQMRYVEMTQIITPRARPPRSPRAARARRLGVAIVLGALAGIALALLSYAVVPTRRRET